MKELFAFGFVQIAPGTGGGVGIGNDHPKTKLFITHGGKLSTTEAIYYGVPVIGIPIFGDQFLNMEQAVVKGYGLKVEYEENLAKPLEIALNEMLNNE
ncbi:UDP-glucuronosyltransferase 2B37, partial [Eumeta japonica]